MPILVLNDEGHHCWRPRESDDELSSEEKYELKREAEEATVWVSGLDALNAAVPLIPGPSPARGEGSSGISMCVDLSATPFYLKGSGHPEGRPFPWLVSDFGLVDAIESGIVKIPRLPVSDTTGRPEATYFRLWETITADLQPAQRLPGRSRKPKPEVVFEKAAGALQQIAGQWVERFELNRAGGDGQEKAPPVLIVVCDNTDIAEVFYRHISGETEAEHEIDEDGDDESSDESSVRGKKSKKKIIHGRGSVFPEHFSNTAQEKRTIRIDSKLLAEAESDDPTKNRSEAAEELRRVVGTVGRSGQPGEKVRCVVSVSMLTEGWDANNVTHILGLRAFGSQLLCEQVVGRGLRRLDYTPDPATGLLTEEYVDVYGIPFSVIPCKGRPTTAKAPEDKLKQHVRAMEERAAFEMRFPNVEGYAFALRKNLIRWNLNEIEPLKLEPNIDPTATAVRATVGYQEGPIAAGAVPVEFHDRTAFYQTNHLQTILFLIAKEIVERLLAGAGMPDRKRRSFGLLARHQLFPQVFALVERFVAERVELLGCDPSELGLPKYQVRLIERLTDAIEPDDSSGETPLLPILNRYRPTGTTADVNFKTTRACHPTSKSHINQVVLDTDSWEAAAAFRLEASPLVTCYARNDELGLTIPYDFEGIDHHYEPDYLVRLVNDLNVVLEVKGYEDEQDRAKHTAARRWVSAINHWRERGRWAFLACRNPQMLTRELEDLASAT
jgi:type III restriction enzyme